MLREDKASFPGDSIAEHASAIWQDFDIALIMPEPYYDQRQYWSKIDTYASSEHRYTSGKVYFCEGCREMQSPEAFSRAVFQVGGNGFPQTCIGCAHTAALKVQSYVDSFQQLADSQKYALASAIYAYDTLQFKNPCDDMVSFLKACAPASCLHRLRQNDFSLRWSSYSSVSSN